MSNPPIPRKNFYIKYVGHRWLIKVESHWRVYYERMENLPDEKRGKVRWKQNLYYLPSLGESSRGTRVRFNYLYFVIMHRVKRGFLSRKKKMASGPEFTFLWIILLTGKKISKKGKKRCLYAKGPPQKRSCFDFFSHTPLFKDVQPVARFPNSNKN